MVNITIRYATRLIGLVALALPLALPAAPGRADEPSASNLPHWVKMCETNADKKQNCMVVQRLITPTGQFFATVSIRQVADSSKDVVVLALPFGVAVQAGVTIQVDAQKPIPMKFTTCLKDGCYAQIAVNSAFIDTFKAGNKLSVTVTSASSNRAMTFPATLAGFTKAYDGAGVDPKTAQAAFVKLAEVTRSTTQTKAASDKLRAALTDPKKTEATAQ